LGNEKILENKIRNIIGTYTDFHDAMFSGKDNYLKRIEYQKDIEQNCLKNIIKNLSSIQGKVDNIFKNVSTMMISFLGFDKEFKGDY
jgi:flagellar biosynthesis/type III secretory pathway M-ring protein FliF/YscJ